MTKARQRERKKKRLAEGRAQIIRDRPISGASLWDELAAIDARLLSKFGPKDEYAVEEIDAVSDELAAEFERRGAGAIK
jgi:hypothetical protein